MITILWVLIAIYSLIILWCGVELHQTRRKAEKYKRYFYKSNAINSKQYK